jgi:hypothetical protein
MKNKVSFLTFGHQARDYFFCGTAAAEEEEEETIMFRQIRIRAKLKPEASRNKKKRKLNTQGNTW